MATRRKAFRGRTPSGDPNPIDVHVGNRVRLRRTLLGLTQTQLGKAVGLTFQQVQKYERGNNRISASRLYDFARVLDVPVNYFFDGMAEGIEAQSPGAMAASDQFVPAPNQDLGNMGKRETLELVRAYSSIGDARLRRRVFNLAKALAESLGVAHPANC